MAARYDEATLRGWINQIERYGKDLTSWEDEFVESVTKSLDANGRLSPKQEEILERIYAEKTP